MKVKVEWVWLPFQGVSFFCWHFTKKTPFNQVRHSETLWWEVWTGTPIVLVRGSLQNKSVPTLQNNTEYSGQAPELTIPQESPANDRTKHRLDGLFEQLASWCPSPSYCTPFSHFNLRDWSKIVQRWKNYYSAGFPDTRPRIRVFYMHAKHREGILQGNQLLIHTATLLTTSFRERQNGCKEIRSGCRQEGCAYWW